MNTRILNRLCCPICKGELELRPFLEEGIEYPQREPFDDSGEPGQESLDRTVRDGVLLCPGCETWYPVFSYVPVMLVFETPFHQRFVEKYAEQLRRIAGYEIPNRQPQPGERAVQDTFTDEWDKVQEDELVFFFSEEDLKELNREVWLKWLKGSRDEVNTVLNVGCGLGHEPLMLQDVAGNAEIFGIDLNFALLKSGEVYRSRPGIHFIIASLFHLPFRPSSFDLVYSEGVLHHTYSTAEAFRSIAPYARKGGYLFTWVYGLDDHLIRRGAAGLATRLNYVGESVMRPLISRAPKTVRDTFFDSASAVLHPLVKTRQLHKEKWKLENTNHGLRDWLSPRYAHRQSYNKVLEWFEDCGFKIIDIQSPSAYRKLFNKQLGGVGMTGKKV